MFRTCLGICWILWTVFVASVAAKAEQPQDVRVALLIANQTGWENEPQLQGIVQYDLEPLKVLLERGGWKVVVLSNRGPGFLRETLRQLKKNQEEHPHQKKHSPKKTNTTSARATESALPKKKIHTLLIYYTGHADRAYLHMGERSKKHKDFRWDELAWFLKKIPIQRKFVVIDACYSAEIIGKFVGKGKKHSNLGLSPFLKKQGYRKYVGKGAAGYGRAFLKKQGYDVKGIQILSSGRGISGFEQKRGSLFTRFFLEGLRGNADINMDGKVSFSELHDYVIEPAERFNGEKPKYYRPEYWYRFGGGGLYGIVPAYHSRVTLDASLLGTFSIYVGNFAWTYRKQTQETERLRILHGDGLVVWQRGKNCWTRKVFFPKIPQHWPRLDQQGWKPISCPQARAAPVSKGPLVRVETEIEIPPEPIWFLALQGGVISFPISSLSGGSLFGGGSLRFSHRYFALRMGVWGTSILFSNDSKLYQQMLLDLRAEGGYGQRWGRFHLFVGGYAGLGLLLQDINQSFRVGGIFLYGLTSTFGVQLFSHLSLSFAFSAGFAVLETAQRPSPLRTTDLTTTKGGWEHLFHVESQIGLAYHF